MKVFEQNYVNLLNSMRSIYPKYEIAYSYKTNYTPKICEIVKKLGGYAEVVSDMEYRLAQRIGYENSQIVYNGPIKGKGLFDHLISGGVANIDSLDELKEVMQFADFHPNKEIKLAFRVNINVGQCFISRFGLDAYEDKNENVETEIDLAFKLVESYHNIKVIGLHCHVGRSRSINAWKNRVRIMFSLIDRYFKQVPEFIDFGSGMNSVMEPELAAQFDEKIPTFDEYASIIAIAMNEKYGLFPEKKKPVLITEPGTTLVSGCMSFLSTVQTIKTVKKKSYVTFDCCGGNMGDICHLKQLPISVFHNSGNIKHLLDASFVGYTCLEHDHIYEGYCGDIAVGDIVQFRNVGSYSNVFKPPFILPNCAMIQIDNDGNSELIKRTETIDDIFQTYIF